MDYANKPDTNKPFAKLEAIRTAHCVFDEGGDWYAAYVDTSRSGAVLYSSEGDVVITTATMLLVKD